MEGSPYIAVIHILSHTHTGDPRDKPFSTDGDQFMIWSMGPVGTLDTSLGDTILVPFRHYARANPTGTVFTDKFTNASYSFYFLPPKYTCR